MQGHSAVPAMISILSLILLFCARHGSGVSLTRTNDGVDAPSHPSLIERSAVSGLAGGTAASDVKTHMTTSKRDGMRFTTSVMARRRSALSQREHFKRVIDTPSDDHNGGSTVVLSNLNSLEAWEAPTATNTKMELDKTKELASRELASEDANKKRERSQREAKTNSYIEELKDKQAAVTSHVSEADDSKALIRPDLKIFKAQQSLVLLEPILVQKSNAFTYLFWVKPLTTISTWGGLIHKGSSQMERNPGIWFYPSSTKLHVRSGTSAGWNDGAFPDPEKPLPLNEWAHVVLSHALNALNVYVNGEVVASRTIVPEPLVNDGALYACFSSSMPANALLTGVRYYPHILTANHVSRIFNLKEYSTYENQ